MSTSLLKYTFIMNFKSSSYTNYKCGHASSRLGSSSSGSSYDVFLLSNSIRDGQVIRGNLESICLLLLAKVLNRFAPIVFMLSDRIYSFIIYSGASCESSRSISSMRHSFLISFSSTSLFESLKSAIWSRHAFSLAMYTNCHLEGSISGHKRCGL